jgi:hypothetical protein
MPNPEKKAGNSGACWKCNQPITCVKTGSYNGVDQLSWQNPDGSGHYKKIGAGNKDFACSSGTGLDGFDTPTKSKEPYEYKHLSEEDKSLYKAIIGKVCEYDILGDEEIAKYPVDQAGVSRGRIKNISSEVLRDIHKHNREES